MQSKCCFPKWLLLLLFFSIPFSVILSSSYKTFSGLFVIVNTLFWVFHTSWFFFFSFLGCVQQRCGSKSQSYTRGTLRAPVPPHGTAHSHSLSPFPTQPHLGNQPLYFLVYLYCIPSAQRSRYLCIYLYLPLFYMKVAYCRFSFALCSFHWMVYSGNFLLVPRSPLIHFLLLAQYFIQFSRVWAFRLFPIFCNYKQFYKK